MRSLADRGVGVLMVSSELPEVLALADRVVVMRQGRVAGELPAAEAGEEAVRSTRSWGAGVSSLGVPTASGRRVNRPLG